MKKRVVAAMLVCVMGTAMLAGCGSKTDDTKTNSAAKAETSAESESKGETFDATTVNVFAAASLNTVMEELIKTYNETQPNVKIVGNYDSSGTLLTQIEEGANCDVFFSAAQKQMDTLQNNDLSLIHI